MRFQALAVVCLSSIFAITLGCGGGRAATPPAATPPAPALAAPVIMADPSSRTVAPGESATFSTAASGDGPLSYQWERDGAAIASANTASYTTAAATTADNGAKFRVVVSNSAGKATSNEATLSVTTTAAVPSLDVVTYHNDIARTGQNLNETVLTTANVNSVTFGRLRSLTVDGKVDAQPLYLSQLAIGGAPHNVVYVATEHGSVYAFDADNGTQLWKVSTLGVAETPSDARACDQVTAEIGITATPVVDRSAGANGVIYVVAMSKSGSTYFQRLHALDVTTGAEMFSGPKNITAQFPGTGDNNSNGNVIFDPAQYKERSRIAPAQRRGVHHLGIALRHSSLYRMDHGVRPRPHWRRPAS